MSGPADSRLERPPIKAPEAARYLGISIRTLYHWTYQKRIPFYKPNRKELYFKPDELEAWVYRNLSPERAQS